MNTNYSNLAQRRALKNGRRVFERSHSGWSELINRDETTGNESWIFRGDISGTIHGTERGLRRLYPNCLITR